MRAYLCQFCVLLSCAVDSPSEREKRWRIYLQKVAGGNAEALAALYDETSSALYNLALRMLRNTADADEVLLEVFEQIWRSAHSFDPERSGARRWLTVLTRSRAVDRLRVLARNREEHGAFHGGNMRSREPWPDAVSIIRQQQVRIQALLCALPQEQREALELAYFSELTHVEIAAALRVPLGTIKTRIRIGMEKLRIGFRTSRLVAVSTR